MLTVWRGNVRLVFQWVGWIEGEGGWSETYGVDVEVACVENNWPVNVEVVHVLEGDVLDVAIAYIWSSPTLESGTVLHQTNSRQ